MSLLIQAIVAAKCIVAASQWACAFSGSSRVALLPVFLASELVLLFVMQLGENVICDTILGKKLAAISVGPFVGHWQ